MVKYPSKDERQKTSVRDFCPRLLVTNVHDGDIINARGDVISKPIGSPIELGHPVDVSLGGKELSQRQQKLLDSLPGFGDSLIVNKKSVSMLDLSTLTAKTGDEFAMFTRKGERLIIRGDAKRVPLDSQKIFEMYESGYKWSGHTHPGFSDADLIASQGDKNTLDLFNQDNSVIYNAAGRHNLIYPGEK